MPQIDSFKTALPGSTGTQALLRVCVFAMVVAVEHRRITSGSHKQARVDACTGAPPSLSQTIVLLGSREGIKWLIRKSSPRHRAQPSHELGLEIQRARRQYADDPEARREAIGRIYRESKLSPSSAFLPVLLRSAVVMAINRVPVPFVSERRTLPDLLAGTKRVA
jgi:hypothetical protein